MRSMYLCLGMLLLTPVPVLAGDRKPDSGSGVALRLALIEAGPNKPAFFRCVLQNTSDKPVEVVDGYDARAVRLVGKGEGQRREVQLYPRLPKKVGTTSVKAGEERTVFELPVDDTLFDLITGSIEPDKQAWTWDWTARPKGPRTPFHESGKTGRLLRRAEVWAEVMIDGKPIATKPLPLELRLAVVPNGGGK